MSAEIERMVRLEQKIIFLEQKLVETQNDILKLQMSFQNDIKEIKDDIKKISEVIISSRASWKTFIVLGSIMAFIFSAGNFILNIFKH